MKSTILLILISFSSFNLLIEKDTYYKALSSKNVQDLTKMLQHLDKEKESSLILAYRGALIAKKASFEKSVSKKVKTFKLGVTLLEGEIKKSPKKVEYRFLRLAIQERCPKILKYNKNIPEDVSVITQEFNKQNSELKKIILDYSKSSNALNPSNLK